MAHQWLKLAGLGLGFVGVSGLGAGTAWAHDVDAKFQLMDADQDGKISAAEHEAGAEKLFQKMDGNRDGQVTATEMANAKAYTQKGVKQQGQAKGQPDRGHTVAASKIKKLDTNEDGVLSADEQAAGAKSRFEQADADKDGSLTKDELRAAHER